MKLLRLKVEGFGALKGEFAFDPERMTVLVDDNERGKSTLLAAVAAALYGLEHNRTVHRVLTPLDRWRPWDGGPYRVELEVESEGERYTIMRDFDRGTVAVWNGHGQEVTVPTPEQPRAQIVDLMEALKRAQRSLPTILITGRCDNAIRTRAKALGVVALLEKPVDFNELMAAITRCGQAAGA